jgi:hypothetical protein
MDRIAKHLHKDSRIVTYPRSVGRPGLTKEGWLQQMKEIMDLWSGDSEVSC